MREAPPSRSVAPSVGKAGRGQFRCYQCRQIFQMKEGDWHPWNTMEVHLCQACDRSTQERPERKKASRM